MGIQPKIDPMAGLKPFAAILNDVAAWASDLLPFLEKDFVILSRLVKARGLPIIMVDMPDAGKIYDHSLSTGFLPWDSLPKTFGKLHSRRGVLFQQLLEKSFHVDGSIRTDVDPNAVFFTRTVLYFAKKVELPCPDEATLDAVNEFRKIESEMRVPSVDWDSDEPDWSILSKVSFLDGYRDTPDMFSHRDPCPKALLKVFDNVVTLVCSQFDNIVMSDLNPRHGPGSVADARRGADKYQFPTWPRKLDHTFPAELYAQPREDMHLEASYNRSLNEPPVKLLAVPKTYKGPRLIASEPVAHQFLQQGILEWIRQNLPYPLQVCIDFHDQEPSQEAALTASIDGKIATIDLTSASDRLSCWVVERCFRRKPEILRALHATRTRWLVNSTGVGEKFFIKLKKHACQGSAATFPLQSIVYACVGIAAMLYEYGRPVRNKSVLDMARRIRVFGDDIIMPSLAVQSLTLLLAHIGLKVNMGKTHVNGHFRESCGMDAYKGYDVTPVYIRDLELGRSAERLASWVDVSNNAYSAGLWTLSEWMMNEIPHKVRRLVPISNRSLSCVTFRTHQDGLLSSSRTRYSRTLHRDEILALQVTTRSIRRRRDSHQSLLQYFVEAPRTERTWDPPPTWSEGWVVRNRIQIRKRWVPSQ